MTDKSWLVRTPRAARCVWCRFRISTSDVKSSLCDSVTTFVTCIDGSSAMRTGGNFERVWRMLPQSSA